MQGRRRLRGALFATPLPLPPRRRLLIPPIEEVSQEEVEMEPQDGNVQGSLLDQ